MQCADAVRILEGSIDKIWRFLEDKSFADFSSDALVHDAVVRNLEIISDASRHLSADTKALAPEVPWPEVATMGNWLLHDYEKVNDQALWETIQDGLPVLGKAARRLLIESGLSSPR